MQRTLTSPPPHPPHPYQRRDVPRACVQVQETSVAQYRDVCKCKKHQLRSTEMFASARNISCVAPRCVQVQRTLTSPPPHPPHPYQRRDVPRACVQVQETSVAQYRDVCKCKKHQLRSTEMFASARNISCVAPRCVQVQRTLTSPPPHPPHPYQRRDVPRACVQVQETSVAQYRDVCKCKKHQLRSTEMCASARNISCVAPRCLQVQETSVA